MGTRHVEVCDHCGAELSNRRTSKEPQIIPQIEDENPYDNEPHQFDIARSVSVSSLRSSGSREH